MLRTASRLMALNLALVLGGCASEAYTEAQDPVTLQFGNAVKTNQIAQMNDPWPANVGNTRMASNGRKMNDALNRYYTGTILPPVGLGTQSSLGGGSASANAGQAPATP